MISPSDEQSLIGGGDCFLHSHSEDRRPSQVLLHGLQGIASQVSVTSDLSLTGDEDYLLVDTSTSNVTITFPKARNGIEVEINKLHASGTVFLQTASANDTILGQSLPVSFTTANASLRFKAFGVDWRII